MAAVPASTADDAQGVAVIRSSHDEYHHVGKYMLNDVPPPNHGQILPMTAVERTTGTEGPAVTAAEFRNAMGHFATGVTIVTSVGADGEPVGTTANAVTSLSLDPPLVLVCFDLGSVTLAAIRGHGAFVVNVLGERQQHLSANFARRDFAAAWDDVRHRRGPTGSPRIEGVLAVVECTVDHTLPGGDHEIIIGRVRHVATNDTGATPLLFWRGRYTALDGKLSALSRTIPSLPPARPALAHIRSEDRQRSLHRASFA
jgi:3-hydroxy-9,10-secoandrosta-1,3,5(10)-triene-9,17-dione monooxygenase reductase component